MDAIKTGEMIALDSPSIRISLSLSASSAWECSIREANIPPPDQSQANSIWRVQHTSKVKYDWMSAQHHRTNRVDVKYTVESHQKMHAAQYNAAFESKSKFIRIVT